MKLGKNFTNPKKGKKIGGESEGKHPFPITKS